MKNMKKILALALVIVSVLAIAAPALAAAWTWRYGTEVDRNSGTNNQVMAVLDVDGYFGDETEAAVIDFQKDKGLTPDGVVGPRTMEKLYEVYLK